MYRVRRKIETKTGVEIEGKMGRNRKKMERERERE